MPESFRILHVIDSLGIGGGQAMLFELYKAIERYYPDIAQSVILLHKKKVNEDYVNTYGIKYHKIGRELITKTVLDYREPVLFLFHKLLCSKTDIYKRLYGRVPIVVLNHTYTDSTIYNRIEPCNLVIAVAESMRKKLRSTNPRLRHKYVHNGVNQELYAQVPALERTGKDRNVFLTGRINSLNSIKYSDRWLEWILNTDWPVKLVHEYIGGGIYSGKAKKVIQRFGKKSNNEIRMLDYVIDFNEKVGRIKTWDIFLYEINRNEGVSMSILEALACGVPVVCSGHDGNREIIQDGVNGFVFDSRAEAEAILTELCLDRKMLAELHESTRQHFAENLDARIAADKYVKFFWDVFEHDTSPNVIKIQKPISNSQKEVLKSFETKPPVKLKGPAMVKSADVKESKMNRKFTILTSGRNNGKYIPDWSRSILAQKYRPLEVVYVNDQSGDDTIERLKQAAKAFKENEIEFKTLNNPERYYCGTSYFNGLREVTGGYFGVLDSDDMLEEDAVEYIMRKYDENPTLIWIYTQYSINKSNMKFRRKGTSRHPGPGRNLLDLGRRRKHAYSHWRTVCLERFPKPDKIFPRGLRCSIDKFMGYRLEEWATGGFVDRICYKYREGAGPKCISTTEPTKKIWAQVVDEAGRRRKKYNLKAHPIEILKP